VLKEPKSVISSELAYPDGAVGSVSGNEKALTTPQKLGGDDK
jgi:hypothetical protein